MYISVDKDSVTAFYAKIILHFIYKCKICVCKSAFLDFKIEGGGRGVRPILKRFKIEKTQKLLRRSLSILYPHTISDSLNSR